MFELIHHKHFTVRFPFTKLSTTNILLNSIKMRASNRIKKKNDRLVDES